MGADNRRILTLGCVILGVIGFGGLFLRAGLPALLVLGLASYMGTMVAEIGRDQLDVSEAAESMRRALITFVVATPFWVWALYKVLGTNDLDYGALTFLLVILASTRTRRGAADLAASTTALPSLEQREAGASRVAGMRLYMRASTGLVAANYLYVLATRQTEGSFQVYLFIGAAYWIALGHWNVSILNSFERQQRWGDAEQHAVSRTARGEMDENEGWA